ncbi:T9SS type A sorting domain-containing protein [Saprospiraceae bacterium]|nr:T9SS type A sorting domain-containing protein [Saprospiraceae bacterium]
MIKSTLVVLSFLMLYMFPLNGQCDLPFPPADVFNEDVPLYCDGLHDFCSQLQPTYTNQPLPGCPFEEFVIDNAQILSFVAGSEFIDIVITPFDCSFDSGQGGMQAALYESYNPFFEGADALVVDCGEGFVDIINLQFDEAIIGKLYYLVLDGWAGSRCSYEIQDITESTRALDITEEPTLSGPETICDGGEFTYVASSDSACSFIWMVNGNVITDYDNPTILVVVDEASSFNICVAATNFCDTSLTTCLNGYVSETSEKDSLVTDMICPGSTYLLGSMEFTQPGEYTFIDTINCEFINFELNLSEGQGSDSTFTEQLCAGGCIVFDGQDICAPGVYTFTFQAANGCDSTITLEVLPLDAPVGIESAEICEGGSYSWNGEEYTVPGIYEFIVVLTDGCDSIAELHLSLTDQLTSTTNALICIGDSYFWNGEFYTVAGEYEEEYTTAEGCDSSAILNLNTIQTEMGFDTDSICAGQIYEWNEMTYNEAGSYTATLVSTQGCDSIVTLHLSWFQDSTYTEVTICEGDVYVFDNVTYDTTVVVANHYTSSVGCDSIRILDLTVIPTTKLDVEAEICELDTFFFSGNGYTVAGNYQIFIESAEACDTVVNLELTVIDTTYTELTVGVTSGEIYNGVVITNDTVFTELYSSVNDCDSTVVTNVVVITNTNDTEIVDGISIYPNPTGNTSTIYFQNALEVEAKLKIMDIHGHILYNEEVMDRVEIELDLTDLSAGTYVILVESKTGLWLSKLVKF